MRASPKAFALRRQAFRRAWTLLVLVITLGAPLSGVHAGTPVSEKPAQTAPSGKPDTPPNPPSGLPSSIPFRRDPEPPLGSHSMGFLQFFTALILVGFLVVWVLRNRNRQGMAEGPLRLRDWRKWMLPAPSAGGFRVLQSSRLNPKTTLHLLQWDNQEWLVGCTDHGLTVLGQRPLSGQPSGDREPVKPEPV